MLRDFAELWHGCGTKRRCVPKTGAARPGAGLAAPDQLANRRFSCSDRTSDGHRYRLPGSRARCCCPRCRCSGHGGPRCPAVWNGMLQLSLVSLLGWRRRPNLLAGRISVSGSPLNCGCHSVRACGGAIAVFHTVNPLLRWYPPLAHHAARTIRRHAGATTSYRPARERSIASRATRGSSEPRRGRGSHNGADDPSGAPLLPAEH